MGMLVSQGHLSLLKGLEKEDSYLVGNRVLAKGVLRFCNIQSWF